MAKSLQKLKAIKLRKQGISIKLIAKELMVSPGSVSVWCRDVKLTQHQIDQLEHDARDPNYGRRLENSIKQHEVALKKTEQLINEGIKEVGEMSKRDLFMVGIALYWAEGFKKDSQVGLGSSDPKMILMFVRWLKECFGYTLSDLLVRVTVNEAHRHRIDMITNYWSEMLGLPASEFRKPFYQHVKWQKVYNNPEEYFGVLRVRVRKSKDFLRKALGMIEGLKAKTI